ncbi:MAG: TldD/PmbA family protein [Kiritimatiellae bacterium]|nr:TldD/PmbA family protein [Kiritimatiellia bacterium]
MADGELDRIRAVFEAALATAGRLGAAGAKLHYGHRRSMGLSFEAGRLKSSEGADTVGFGVEVLVGGKLARTRCNALSDLDEMVARAVALAKLGSPAHFGAYPAPAAPVRVKTHSESTTALSRDRIVESAGRIVEALKAYDAGMYIQAGGGRSETESLLMSSGGVSHASRGTSWMLSGGVQRTTGTDMLFAGYGRGWRELNAFFDPDAISDRILTDLRHGEKIVEAPTGTVPLFIPPEMVRPMLAPLFLGVNGKNVVKGDSPLRGRLGETIMNPAVTIRDDPHVDFNPGAAEIDGDGVPTRVIDIVKDGVLQTFLYDLDTAGMAKTEPTGNAGCSPYSPQLLPGAQPSDALLAAIDDGIYVRFGIGFGQSNMMNGDVSFNVGLGYRVKRGEILGRVKNTMVAGNFYELFKNNVAISSDTDPILRMPAVVMEGARVSSAAG